MSHYHNPKEIEHHDIAPGVHARPFWGDELMLVVVNLDPYSEVPPHSHPHEQVAYVAEGEVIFLMDGEETHLRPGDMYLVPSGRPHSIQQLTEHVRLVDCFTPIREDFLK